MSEYIVPKLSRSDEYKQLIAQKRDKKLKELQTYLEQEVIDNENSNQDTV